jgi:hypothetical protein
MKLLSALPVSLTFALLVLGVVSCGESRRETGSASGVASSEPATAAATSAMRQTAGGGRGDRDYDDVHGLYDSDNGGVTGYGKAAAPTEKRAITKLVERYYAAAAAGDGGSACALIYSRLARAVPDEYGRSPGPVAWRGKTCAVVVSKLFKQLHRQVAMDVAALEVRSVRVNARHGLALLGFGRLSEERVISVEREGDVWKMGVLLDGGLA